MEIFTIILASLLTIISPGGVVIDQVIADNIRAQVKGVEQLSVRVDNTPSYQILQGKVDKIRVASRGIQPIQDVRIEELDLETDSLNINLERLQQGGDNTIDKLRESLRKPLQGAVHLILKETDINQALQSPKVKAKIQKILNGLLPKGEGITEVSFELLTAHIDFLENNRLGVQLQLQQTQTEENSSDKIDLSLEVGLKIIDGHSLELVEPTGKLNGRKLSSRLLKGFADKFSEKLDLKTFEKQGIIARVLQFNLTEDEIDLAAFIRLEELNN